MEGKEKKMNLTIDSIPDYSIKIASLQREIGRKKDEIYDLESELDELEGELRKLEKASEEHTYTDRDIIQSQYDNELIFSDKTTNFIIYDLLDKYPEERQFILDLSKTRKSYD